MKKIYKFAAFLLAVGLVFGLAGCQTVSKVIPY
jgi:hypothetical protein